MSCRPARVHHGPGTLERPDLLIPEIRSLLAAIRSQPITQPAAR